MLAAVRSATLVGVEGRAIRVEAHVARGLPGFTLVGLPDAACREARDRVRAAVASAGFDFPQRRVTVNLAPGGVPKIGTALDLAIAVGVLQADEQLAGRSTEGIALVGELGLDGSLRPSRGIIPLVSALVGEVEAVVVPRSCHADAALVPGLTVRAVESLAEAVSCLVGEAPWPDPPPSSERPPPPEADFVDVRGQGPARLAAELAAAGGHHLLMVGPPGAGKTLLASRLPSILPDLGDEDALAVSSIWSAAGEPVGGLRRRPPFRAPHHTTSAVAIIGGGTASLRPGEISLAHRGVLFADELGEFPPTVLDALRQPLEEGVIRVARARSAVTYPARFQLVAATNPCPCGEGGEACRCRPGARQRYGRRISGPLLDRFDLRLWVGRPTPSELLGSEVAESSAVLAERVRAARSAALERQGCLNTELSSAGLERFAPLSGQARSSLVAQVEAGRLSGRGLQRIRRLGRTIADLNGSDVVGTEDVDLAVQFRSTSGLLDRGTAA